MGITGEKLVVRIDDEEAVGNNLPGVPIQAARLFLTAIKAEVGNTGTGTTIFQQVADWVRELEAPLEIVANSQFPVDMTEATFKVAFFVSIFSHIPIWIKISCCIISALQKLNLRG